VATIVVVAIVLAFARPAWAHTVAVTGSTSCPDANHLVSWDIHNNETSSDRTLTILSATATIGGNTYAVQGYDAVVPPQGDTQATTVIPGDVTGTVTITVQAHWPDDFKNHATGSVELQAPCLDTSTTVPPTTAPPTTAPPATPPTGPPTTPGPPVSQGNVPSSGGPQGSVAGIESGPGAAGTLPRTGADTTNWALVGLVSLAFGGSLLLVGTKRFARR
jgi:LPXTG-motif cell wall-anchored protein